MPHDGYDVENVLAISFDEHADAYEALARLKELDAHHQIDLHGAAVVARADDGRIVEKDEAGDPELINTASGGIIGLLVGILGGPFGVLIGGATGILVGSLFDLDDEDETDSVLSEISTSVPIGHLAVLADVSEPDPVLIDAVMAGLGGTILRRSIIDVEAEIASAEDAQAKARRKARHELRDARRKEHKKHAHARVEALKAKLHHHPQKAAATRS